ncbi:MAG: amidohydrolase [Deltaproteobacteria bacterium]|nr:amidohydrolase [Deltaproteobacteria bacterium]
MDEIKADVRPEIRALYDQMVATRRDLHRHPELAFQEERTGGIVAERLAALGYDVRRAAKTGVIATLRGGDGPAVAFRADMDALPLTETADRPYRSVNDGRMHACGHDGHTAILLAFAEYAAATRDRFGGTIKLLFQPAEEGPGGAKPMIGDGALRDPEPARVFGLHLWNNLDAGYVALKAGPFMASADEFIVTVVGKGGHGAMPHLSVDPIPVAAQIVGALQTIVTREIPPAEPAVLTVGEIHGGSNFNIIAPEVRLRGTVRTLRPERRAFMRDRIGAVAQNIAAAMGAETRYEWIEHYPVTVNDADAAALVAREAAGVLGADAVVESETTLAAEDMSFYLERVPGCYFFLGSRNEKLGLIHPHHHPHFDFDERVMPVGVEIFARLAESALSR